MAITAADRVEIQELIARYNRAIDTGRADDWAACFVPDGEFEGVVGRFRGRDELAAFVREYWTSAKYEEFRIGQHWVNNVIVDEAGEDEATVFAHQLMIRPGADGVGVINLMAWYDDRVRKVDGRWLFVKRKVNPVQTSDRWASGDAAGAAR
jgi:uncharacterized protein (TIGR02246 family)